MSFLKTLVGIFIIVVVVMYALSFMIPTIVIMDEAGFIFCGIIAIVFTVIEGD